MTRTYQQSFPSGQVHTERPTWHLVSLTLSGPYHSFSRVMNKSVGFELSLGEPEDLVRHMVTGAPRWRHGYWQRCAICSLELKTRPPYWQIWIKVDARTGYVIEDLANSWLSGCKRFPNFDFARKRMFEDIDDKSILWAYCCPADARSRSWWDGKFLDD